MTANAEVLGAVKFFSLLSSDDLESLVGQVHEKKLSQNEILFHAGEPGDSLYVVKSGAVELYVKDTAGQKIVLKIAETNESFGELSLFDNKPRSATALALTDAVLLVIERRDLLYLFHQNPEAALRMLSSVSEMTRTANELLRTRVARNVNEEIEEKLSPLQRVSDWIAWFSGSMLFLFINGFLFLGWILLNLQPFGLTPFDPFPFGFLTMITSIESIFLSCFVLISQNRQAEKDRVRGDIEYDVNIKAEMEITHLHEKTDRLYEQMLERFNRLEKSLDQK